MEYIFEFIYSILRFFPRFKIIREDECAIRLTLGKCVEVYWGASVAWYWPVITIIEITIASTRCLDIPEQTVTTSKGDTYVLNGSVLYRVTKPLVALLENEDFEANLQEDASDALRSVVSCHSTLDCQDIIEDVTRELEESETRRGVLVEEVKLAEFAKAIAIRLIGVN